MKHYTPKEIAADLQVDENKVTGWIRTGQLIAVDVSHKRGGKARYRISEESYQTFLLSRQTEAKTPTKRKRRRGDFEIVAPYKRRCDL